MTNRKVALGMMVVALYALGGGARIGYSQEKAASTGVQVHMVIAAESVSYNREGATLRDSDIQVKQGRNVLKVNHLIPARGDNAALQLFILIDDTCDTALGINLNDLRDFVNAQPANTVIGIGYMSNANVQILQNFTADHALAAKTIRLPRGNLSSMDSPYLSLVSLVKGWPQGKVRREVLMVTDGIDRLRGRNPLPAPSALSNGAGTRGMPPPVRPIGSTNTRMVMISVDADPASQASQRAGVIVHSIYARGVGRFGRNAWEEQLGQSGIAKIAGETGGEYYALGTQDAVSFKPYLDRLQRVLDNQYYLVFEAAPKKKAGLQRVNISTEVPDAEIAAADNVWVPAAE
jgi:hypothetical protein